MSEKIDMGGYAYPCPHESAPELGMTLLDYFAAKAMPSVLQASPKSNRRGFQIEAEVSYEIAQAMLAEKRRVEGGR